MTITRLQRTAAAAAALAFPASMAFFAPSAQAEAPAEPFGPACASVPKEGAGSLEGMAKDPVATAASNNPELSTLVSAVQKAGLVDTLNNAENITVFAPTNAAFEKIPQADLNALLNDKEELTKVLTYHVVGEKLTTKQLEDGTYKTLQGSDLTVKGSGTDFTVNDSSKIVCGNVPTANATVNLVDTVLMPTS
ncbi:fasciclin domain-containing protein [Streptomyces microflavus]|uniref:Fasciclin domain-containing protein n=1 Tax=Streptomyces microflavus TaxID=1919 RepID=A0A6N9V954_STRMI|nr:MULTISPECIES: fasciclin domain-containing protein [Streptomyces]MBK3585058.1 fasciclin domain-containing protein [Streptomyces sp. MBT57]MBK5991376.1 fasciclin domain-containing protein [Streptomyces sp. MBT58]MBW3362519.1 fasciclin domain-containing protein [Streptomyces sp. 09ZI22]MEE1734244.1 fasciclin domain-containing protein [Streptomyces sp. BE282]MEE1734605.1 fasciclin domain-containing protein [Streptomyces sp. BE282]